jgi:hypothetical protein
MFLHRLSERLHGSVLVFRSMAEERIVLFGRCGRVAQGKDLACTSKSTIYTANVAAGLAVGQLAKWLRNMPVDPDLCLNILTSELACGVQA